MKIFVTGGTGYIGSEVVRELVSGGHAVTALSRTSEKDAQLRGLGATPVRGDIASGKDFLRAAGEHDALVHLATTGDQDMAKNDLAVLEGMLQAAKGARSPRHVLYTSGVWVLGNTGNTPATEESATDHPLSLVTWRVGHEKIALAANAGAVATSVIRPGIVYGGREGIAGALFESAVKEGAARFVGSPDNRVPYVHRADLARLYRLVIEKRAAGVFHGVDGAAVRIEDAARAASQAAGKGGKTKAVPYEEAQKTMGPFAEGLASDQVVTAPRSLQLGWKPQWKPFPESAAKAFAEWKG